MGNERPTTCCATRHAPCDRGQGGPHKSHPRGRTATADFNEFRAVAAACMEIFLDMNEEMFRRWLDSVCTLAEASHILKGVGDDAESESELRR